MPYNKKAVRSNLIQKGDTELPDFTGTGNRMIVTDSDGNLLPQLISNVIVSTGPPPPVSSLTETATQAAHGFAKFSVIRHNGTAWVRTLAVQATDTDASSEVFGVVSQVIDADTFVLTIGGKLDTTGLNLLPGTAYFASPTVPGALTATPPTQENHVVKAVLVTSTANTAYVVNYIGEVLGTQPISNVPGQTVQFATEAEWLASVSEKAISPNLLKPKLDAKVDKSGVKILTDENYTALEKNKLALLPQNPVRSVNGVSPDPTTGNVIVSTGTGAADIRVSTIAVRNALTGLADNQNVFVADATGDPTVIAGSAYYKYVLTGAIWIKLSEAESMDLTFTGFTRDNSAENSVIYTWANTLNSFFSGIATVVPGQALLRSTLNWLAARIITVEASVPTPANILALLLTGLGSLTGTITSADSIITAFSRIKGFIDNIAATVRTTTLSSVNVNLPGTVGNTDTIEQAVGKLQRQISSPALSGAQSGGAVDFATAFQSRTLAANETLTLNTFTNQALGKTVRLELTTGSGSSLTFNVPGMVRLNTGFPFIAGVVNSVDIQILPGNKYETFIYPFT